MRTQRLRLELGSSVDRLEPLIRFLRSNLLAAVGLTIITALIVLAIGAPYISVQHPVSHGGGERWVMSFTDVLQPPSWVHPFGTDDLGHDIFSMVLYGGQKSLRVGLIVVAISSIIGGLLGAFSGYRGGTWDELLMRVTDIFFAIPAFILAMAVGAALGPSLDHVMLSLVVVWWPTYARIMRGLALSVRENLYVEAARAAGASPSRVVLVHIIPNSVAPILVQATMDIGNVILVAAGLGFLGLGSPPGTAEWGIMISQGAAYIVHDWWWVTFPGLFILLTVLAFNLLGDGLRDFLDPRLRRG
ncbi:MAG: ABC transporter permease [Candidatus Bathyarchaeia archaeon]